MRLSSLRALALVAVASTAHQQRLAAQITAPRIPFERYTLPSNGLTVILSEDHTTPMVTVDVWYHVGSKNEEPGRTGFAHLGATSNAIATLYLQNLPQDYYQTFAAKINAVTKDDLVRVAKKYIDLEHLDIIIVGDRAVIEDPLRRTNIAPIVALDIDGKPVGTRVQP